MEKDFQHTLSYRDILVTAVSRLSEAASQQPHCRDDYKKQLKKKKRRGKGAGSLHLAEFQQEHLDLQAAQNSNLLQGYFLSPFQLSLIICFCFTRDQ